MKKLILTLVTAGMVSLAALSGALANNRADDGFKRNMRDKLPKMTNQAIWAGTLYDWKAVDWYNLIVWAPSRKDAYLLQLETPCPSLRFVDTIGFIPQDSRITSYGASAVVVDRDVCRIGSITKLDDKSLKTWLERAKASHQAERAETAG